MQSAPIPLDEARRLVAVRALALVDTPAEERFDRITRVAQRLFGSAAATISLVDETREWIKSSSGFPHHQLARTISFAAHAIGAGDTFVVEDTQDDSRFHDHPLVTGDPRIRFYAGRPLQAADTAQVGVLSIYDVEPHAWSRSETAALADIADIAQREMRQTGLSGPQLNIVGDASELSRIDPVTRLWNRGAMLEIARGEMQQARSARRGVAVLMIAIEPVADDDMLSEVARILRASLRPNDVIARFGGNDFAVLLSGVESSRALDAAERVRISIARQLHTMQEGVSVTIGAATSFGTSDFESLARAAESALWSARRRGGNTINVARGVTTEEI